MKVRGADLRTKTHVWTNHRCADDPQLASGPDRSRVEQRDRGHDFEQPLDLLSLDSVSLLWIAGELAEWLEIEITTAMVFENTNLSELSQKTFEIYLAKKTTD